VLLTLDVERRAQDDWNRGLWDAMGDGQHGCGYKVARLTARAAHALTERHDLLRA
jgi:hypothetical protein